MIGAVQGYAGVKLSKIEASESRMVNNPGSRLLLGGFVDGFSFDFRILEYNIRLRVLRAGVNARVTLRLNGRHRDREPPQRDPDCCINSRNIYPIVA